MKRRLTDEECVELRRQVEQISAFLEHCYDGMAHDLTISWTLRDGYDPVRNCEHKSYSGAADYAAIKGKHTKITVGYGDAYWGSSSLGSMLHDAAYEWREKLVARLDDKEPTYPDLMAD